MLLSKVNLARFHSWTYHWGKFGGWWVYVRKLYRFRSTLLGMFVVVDKGDGGEQLVEPSDAADFPTKLTGKRKDLLVWLKESLPNAHSLDVANDILGTDLVKELAWGSLVPAIQMCQRHLFGGACGCQASNALAKVFVEYLGGGLTTHVFAVAFPTLCKNAKPQQIL